MRYPVTAFSIPRPHYVAPPPNSALFDDMLRSPTPTILEKLKSHQVLPQGKARSLGGGLGFFDQGIIAGLVVVSAPLLLGIAASCYYARFKLGSIF
jgi:hypothetical protein